MTPILTLGQTAYLEDTKIFARFLRKAQEKLEPKIRAGIRGAKQDVKGIYFGAKINGKRSERSVQRDRQVIKAAAAAIKENEKKTATMTRSPATMTMLTTLTMLATMMLVVTTMTLTTTTKWVCGRYELKTRPTMPRCTSHSASLMMKIQVTSNIRIVQCQMHPVTPRHLPSHRTNPPRQAPLIPNPIIDHLLPHRRLPES